MYKDKYKFYTIFLYGPDYNRCAMLTCHQTHTHEPDNHAAAPTVFNKINSCLGLVYEYVCVSLCVCVVGLRWNRNRDEIWKWLLSVCKQEHKQVTTKFSSYVTHISDLLCYLLEIPVNQRLYDGHADVNLRSCEK